MTSQSPSPISVSGEGPLDLAPAPSGGLKINTRIHANDFYTMEMNKLKASMKHTDIFYVPCL